jgi:hypothetical protein
MESQESYYEVRDAASLIQNPKRNHRATPKKRLHV